MLYSDGNCRKKFPLESREDGFPLIERPASPGSGDGLCLYDLKFGFRRVFIEADLHLAIGVYRKWIITAATADDDFSEKNPDFGLHPALFLADGNNRDRYITVIDVAALVGALVKGQGAGGQVLQTLFQGLPVISAGGKR